jgi:hypothetical protein
MQLVWYHSGYLWMGCQNEGAHESHCSAKHPSSTIDFIHSQTGRPLIGLSCHAEQSIPTGKANLESRLIWDRSLHNGFRCFLFQKLFFMIWSFHEDFMQLTGYSVVEPCQRAVPCPAFQELFYFTFLLFGGLPSSDRNSFRMGSDPASYSPGSWIAPRSADRLSRLTFFSFPEIHPCKYRNRTTKYAMVVSFYTAFSSLFIVPFGAVQSQLLTLNKPQR